MLLLHRAADNWKLLKELEKAAKVYWSAKDRLPPRVCVDLSSFLRFLLFLYKTQTLLFAFLFLVWSNNRTILYVLQTVKIDINIETDLAYALKVKECPQLLFLKGNKILYREKGILNTLLCKIFITNIMFFDTDI